MIPSTTLIALSAGTVSDEMTGDGIDIKVGCINMGTLSYIQNAYSDFDRFNALISLIAAKSSINVLCTKFLSSRSSIMEHNANSINTICAQSDKNIYFGVELNKYIISTIKLALNGTLLYYELADPIHIDFNSTVDLNYKVADFGTEEIIPENGSTPLTTALIATIAYSDDFTKTIVNLPKNYQSQDSMDSLLSVLGTACGGTFTKTWDSTNNKYNFSFTKSTDTSTN